MPVRSSVCLSMHTNSAPSGQTFMKSDIWWFFENLSRKRKFNEDLTLTTPLHEDPCAFMLPGWILHYMFPLPTFTLIYFWQTEICEKRGKQAFQFVSFICACCPSVHVAFPCSSISAHHSCQTLHYQKALLYIWQTHFLETTGTNDRYKRPVQTTSTNEWYKRPVRTNGTNNRYKRPVQTTGTNDRYKRPVQTTGTNDRYKLLVQTTGTNDRYKRVSFVTLFRWLKWIFDQC
jgi:hypothetical protein